ncbi:MAG: DUF1015 family protein [Chitinophagales bacterium]
MDIKPFRGYRPVPELAAKVAIIPNNLMNEPDRRRAAKNNAYSFAHIAKPGIDFSDDLLKTDLQLFEYSRKYFEKLLAERIIIRDTVPSFYIYRLTMDSRSQTGLICCMNIRDYRAGKIKKHEHTREEKEIENALQIEVTHLNSNPVFLAYTPVTEIDQLVDSITISQRPLYHFASENGVLQNLWVVNENDAVEKLIASFGYRVPAAYIADGHHRAAAANIFSKKINSQPVDSASKDYDYFLTCLFPANQLKIYDYNRVVKSLKVPDEKIFIKKVEEKFYVEEAQRVPYDPHKKHHFGMYLNGKWFRLKAKPGTYKEDPVSALDVSILQNNLLNPILGIHDPRTDKNIDFIAGVKGLKELERRVNKGKAAVAFSLYSVSMDELMAVSDAGEVMPPKSTWFEPKLLSGLVIFRMEL